MARSLTSEQEKAIEDINNTFEIASYKKRDEDGVVIFETDEGEQGWIDNDGEWDWY